MATTPQKEAARRNISKARQAQSAKAHGEKVPRQGQGMSTRIRTAARRHGVEVSEESWRDLAKGGKDRRR